MDADLRAMQRAMTAYKIRRNFVSPSNRLLPELFARVFAFLAEEEPAGDKENTMGILGWILVTHVCRRWRQIAIDHASLWQRIPLVMGVRWTEEFLARSRTAPLVFLGVQAQITLPLIHLMGEHLFRTKGLHITVYSGTVSEALALVLSGSADMMEVLEISTVNAHHPPRPPTLLPKSLLDHSAPRLRSLSLRHNMRYIFSARSHILSNLVSLDIRMQSIPNADRSSLDELLGALEHMPVLESLTIVDCLQSPPIMMSADRVVKLGALTSLRLQDNTVNCCLVLRNLEAATGAALSLSVERATSAEQLQNLFQVTARYLRVGPKALDLPILKLALLSEEFLTEMPTFLEEEAFDYYVVMQAWRHIDRSEPQPLWDLTDADISLSIQLRDEAEGYNLVPDLCREMVASRLEEFMLLVSDDEHEMNNLWSTSTWRDVMSPATGLQDILVHAAPGKSLISALNPRSSLGTLDSQANSSIPAHVFLPRLERLSLYRVEWMHGISQLSVAEPDPRESLSARKLAGYPLKEWIGCESIMPDEWVDRIEDTVLTVHWDDAVAEEMTDRWVCQNMCTTLYSEC